METPRHVFREYDIRGQSDVELTDELVFALGRAIASGLRGGSPAAHRPRVAVARDCRLSGPRLWQALSAGLRRSGADVIDLGVGPTPLLYFAAHQLRTDGSVMITGSHNPPDENGFKLMQGTTTMFGADVQVLRERIEAEDFHDAAFEGTCTALDLAEPYIEAVRQASRRPAGAPPGLCAVVDAGNGAAGPLGVRTLRALGFEVEPLFCEMDGHFPNHHPDPTVEENLVALRQRVTQTGAALGIAWDGDGDRLGVIDDQGAVVWGDKLLILFARQVLEEHPGAVILGEVKCSQTLFSDIAAHGGEARICRTGHSLIKRRMKQEKALLAGEMSGHLFFADRYFGFDDAIYAAVRLLEIVSLEGGGLRELLADVPRTASTPEIRVPCAEAVKRRVVATVAAHFRARYPVLEVDGARIDFGDDAWGLCRASNTGPVLVLRFEAKSPERCDEIRREVEAVVARAQQQAPEQA